MSATECVCASCWYVLPASAAPAGVCPGCWVAAPVDGWSPLPFLLEGRYRLTGQLGRGGMGAVMRAEDTRTGRLVAIKLPLPSKTFEDILEAEQGAAKLLGRYEAHFVKVFAADTFVVMEYLPPPWTTLRHHLDELGRLDPLRVARLGAALLKAVRLMENHGIIHCDLKPENVFVRARGDGDYDAKIYDFGGWIPALREPANESVLPRPRPIAGTPSYMSPEQLLGIADTLDPPVIPRQIPLTTASDLHALASMLWESAAGAPPYDTDPSRRPHQVWVAERLAALRSPPVRPPSMPQQLYDILATALRFEAEHRRFHEGESNPGTSGAKGMQKALEKFVASSLEAAERTRRRIVERVDAMRHGIEAIHGPTKKVADEAQAFLDELTRQAVEAQAGDPGAGEAKLDALQARHDAVMNELHALAARVAAPAPVEVPAPSAPPQARPKERGPRVLTLVFAGALLVTIGFILRGYTLKPRSIAAEPDAGRLTVAAATSVVREAPSLVETATVTAEATAAPVPPTASPSASAPIKRGGGPHAGAVPAGPAPSGARSPVPTQTSPPPRSTPFPPWNAPDPYGSGKKF